MEFDARNFMLEQANRNIRSLFKGFLGLLEDLRHEHTTNFSKLKNSLPEEYRHMVDLVDYFSDDRFAYYRKRVLDMGNDAIRSGKEDIEKVEVSFIFRG